MARSTEATAKVTLCHNLSRVSLESGEGGGEIRPAGDRSHGAGACGHRAGVPRWGIAGAVSGEQRGALPRDVSRPRRDRTRRRVGGLRSMCSPSDRSQPAGQNKTSTEWKTREGPPTRRARKKPHAVKRKRGWWRRGESNPRPEDLGRWCLRAQPTFGSRRGGWV